MNGRALLLLMAALMIPVIPVRGQDTQAVPLRYRFQPGQVLEFDVAQHVMIDMTVQGQSTTVTSETTSRRIWEVLEVGADGVARIQLSTTQVQMRSTEGEKTIEFDSSDPDKQPESLQHIAKAIGVPLSELRVSPQGKVLEETTLFREEGVTTVEGAQVLVPLPADPVAPGHTWRHPFPIKLPSGPAGATLEYPARQVFTFKKIDGPRAVIEFSTAVLTPIDDPRIEALLAQHRPAGIVHFDFRQGLVASQQTSQDETVVGFAGPASSFRIQAKYKERLVRNSVSEVADSR